VDHTNYKRRVEQRYEKPLKKNQTEILEIKNPLVNKKHSGMPLRRLEQLQDRLSELEDK
jgi:hypothetical protein